MKATALRRRLWLASVTSGLLLFVTAFERSLVDVLTPFLFPVLEIGAWLLFLGSSVWAVVGFTVADRRGLREARPLLLSMLAAVVVLVTPFTSIWLRANWHWYRGDRERIVRQVQEGKLSVAGSLLPLGSEEPYVSVGGNEIVVEEHDGGRYVFFYTFRGVLDSYSGFLHVPDGGTPTRFADLSEPGSTQLDRLGAHWYFAARR